MTTIVEKAVAELKAELERCAGNPKLIDPERPLRALMDAGYSPDEASEAIDQAEEQLGIWS
jgi:Holliday junction resolvasome RuvABC DNA-binding subunit